MPVPLGVPSYRDPIRIRQGLHRVVGGPAHLVSGPGIAKPDTRPGASEGVVEEGLPAPPVFPEILFNGLTEGEATYGGLEALREFLRTIQRTGGPIPGGPSTIGFSEGVILGTNSGNGLFDIIPSISIRPQVHIFPPFAGIETGFTTIYKIPARRGSDFPWRVVIAYTSADLGVGAKGGAKVPPTGLTNEVKVISNTSQEFRDLIARFPGDVDVLASLPIGPRVTRNELLFQGKVLEAALLFPQYQGKPYGFNPPPRAIMGRSKAGGLPAAVVKAGPGPGATPIVTAGPVHDC
jgi:hypothetical protein